MERKREEGMEGGRKEERKDMSVLSFFRNLRNINCDTIIMFLILPGKGSSQNL